MASAGRTYAEAPAREVVQSRALAAVTPTRLRVSDHDARVANENVVATVVGAVVVAPTRRTCAEAPAREVVQSRAPAAKAPVSLRRTVDGTGARRRSGRR